MIHTTRHLRGSRGFTLVEMLAAISVLGVLSAVAASSFRAQIPALRTRGAALQVAGDMNQARFAAIREGRLYDYMPLEGTSYQIRRADGLGGMEVVKEVDIDRDFPHVFFGRTGVEDDPYGNPIAGSVPGAPILFHSNGLVQNGAGVFIETVTGDGPAQRAVTVTAAGRIRVWRYDGEEWS